MTKVASQVVAGTNFLISLERDSGDKYEVLVYHNLQGKNKIIQAWKNSSNIYQTNYNYNDDPIFIDYYQVFKKETGIVNIPAISSVERQIIGDLFYYKINYGEN